MARAESKCRLIYTTQRGPRLRPRWVPVSLYRRVRLLTAGRTAQGRYLNFAHRGRFVRRPAFKDHG